MRASDKGLGMNQRIYRRDFLNSTLLSSHCVIAISVAPSHTRAARWSKCRGRRRAGVGDQQRANGSTFEAVKAGHDIRFGVFPDACPRARHRSIHTCIGRGKRFRISSCVPEGNTNCSCACLNTTGIGSFDTTWLNTHRSATRGTEGTAHFDNSAKNPGNPDPAKTVIGDSRAGRK
jgi:hypothetical protein